MIITALDFYFSVVRCKCGACNWSPGSSISNYTIINTDDAEAATATSLLLLPLGL